VAGRTVTDVIRGVSDSPKDQPGKIFLIVNQHISTYSKGPSLSKDPNLR